MYTLMENLLFGSTSGSEDRRVEESFVWINMFEGESAKRMLHEFFFLFKYTKIKKDVHI